jgi:hypothetical protein
MTGGTDAGQTGAYDQYVEIFHGHSRKKPQTDGAR